MDKLMTASEASEYLRVNYMTVYKLAQSGKIPATKVGGRWRLERKTLDTWIAKHAAPRKGSVLVAVRGTQVAGRIRRIVAEQGHKVVIVTTGDEALNELGRKHYDLILLDPLLASMTWTPYLASLRRKTRRATVGIIADSGKNTIAEETMALSPLLLIRKGFRVEEIVKVLNMAIS